MPDKSVVVASAEMLETVILDSQKALSEESQEAVQTVVWLIGLASVLLVFLASKEQAFIAAASERAWLSMLLFATIGAGVLQRLLQQVRRQADSTYTLALRGIVASFKYEADEPSTLNSEWPKARVVANIKHFFGFDYSFLLDPAFGLEDAQAIYEKLYDAFRTFDKKRAGEFDRLLAAITGAKESPSIAAASQSPVEPLNYDRVRSAERSARYWSLAARTAFRLTAILFLTALCTLLGDVFSRLTPTTQVNATKPTK